VKKKRMTRNGLLSLERKLKKCFKSSNDLFMAISWVKKNDVRHQGPRSGRRAKLLRTVQEPKKWTNLFYFWSSFECSRNQKAYSREAMSESEWQIVIGISYSN
jgi:hypothetical protein